MEVEILHQPDSAIARVVLKAGEELVAFKASKAFLVENLYFYSEQLVLVIFGSVLMERL